MFDNAKLLLLEIYNWWIGLFISMDALTLELCFWEGRQLFVHFNISAACIRHFSRDHFTCFFQMLNLFFDHQNQPICCSRSCLVLIEPIKSIFFVHETHTKVIEQLEKQSGAKFTFPLKSISPVCMLGTNLLCGLCKLNVTGTFCTSRGPGWVWPGWAQKH